MYFVPRAVVALNPCYRLTRRSRTREEQFVHKEPDLPPGIDAEEENVVGVEAENAQVPNVRHIPIAEQNTPLEESSTQLVARDAAPFEADTLPTKGLR